MKNLSRLAIGLVTMGALTGCFQSSATGQPEKVTAQQKKLADIFNGWDSHAVQAELHTYLYYNNSSDEIASISDDMKHAASNAGFRLCAEKEWAAGTQGASDFQIFVNEHKDYRPDADFVSKRKFVSIILSEYEGSGLDTAGHGYLYGRVCPPSLQ